MDDYNSILLANEELHQKIFSEFALIRITNQTGLSEVEQWKHSVF